MIGLAHVTVIQLCIHLDTFFQRMVIVEKLAVMHLEVQLTVGVLPEFADMRVSKSFFNWIIMKYAMTFWVVETPSTFILRLKKSVVLLILIIPSCLRTGDLYYIDPRNFENRSITLSEIADGIEYIRLDDSISIGIIYKIKITEEHIYLSAEELGIIQFNRSGQFIRKFGNIGRGPGEYKYGMDFAVEERSGNVYVIDYNEIKIFKSNGYFYKNIQYDKYIGGYGFAGDIEFLNSLIFLPDYITKGDSEYNWVLIDTCGNLVSYNKNKVHPSSMATTSGGIFKYGNKICYYNCINDTVFSISDNLKSEVRYLFNKDIPRLPKAELQINSESQLRSVLYDLFLISFIIETKNFLLMQYGYLDKGAFALIEKRTHDVFACYKELEYSEENALYRKTMPYIKNDLDGGLPLSGDISYYSDSNNENLVSLINPLDIKNHVFGDSEFKNSTPKYPEKKIEFEKLANSLKETDNPVLMVVRLKE